MEKELREKMTVKLVMVVVVFWGHVLLHSAGFWEAFHLNKC